LSLHKSPNLSTRIENRSTHISVLSVTNREYGTGAGFPDPAAAFGLLADWTGSDDILSTGYLTSRNLIAFFS
jgi:hypothetical protein